MLLTCAVCSNFDYGQVEARENIRLMLDELGEVEGVDIAVRVNSVGSGLLEEDLKVIMAARCRPQTILLPKSDTVDDLVLVGLCCGFFLFHVCLLFSLSTSQAGVSSLDQYHDIILPVPQ